MHVERRSAGSCTDILADPGQGYASDDAFTLEGGA